MHLSMLTQVHIQCCRPPEEMPSTFLDDSRQRAIYLLVMASDHPILIPTYSSGNGSDMDKCAIRGFEALPVHENPLPLSRQVLSTEASHSPKHVWKIYASYIEGGSFHTIPGTIFDVMDLSDFLT